MQCRKQYITLVLLSKHFSLVYLLRLYVRLIQSINLINLIITPNVNTVKKAIFRYLRKLVNTITVQLIIKSELYSDFVIIFSFESVHKTEKIANS